LLRVPACIDNAGVAGSASLRRSRRLKLIPQLASASQQQRKWLQLAQIA
jgi:hypothetical protein